MSLTRLVLGDTHLTRRAASGNPSAMVLCARMLENYCRMAAGCDRLHLKEVRTEAAMLRLRAADLNR